MTIDQKTLRQALQGNIIEELGLESLSLEKKEALLESMADLVEARLMVYIGEKLSKAERSEFDRVLNQNEVEAMGWLEQRGISFSDLLVREIAKVKAQLIERAEKSS
ncbi:MAG: hypothetical protein HY220_03970 [Candidatus Sungbacteria bacterium]|uniref:Uncharacterized protein n=1 Tax=Candidatus Sungiibacteriota bacterium TaxID=2750080 RepID=A0A9D6QVU6_9BACT|nr:hypothetical protein [Candidatus Sungbacteria bacterium]